MKKARTVRVRNASASLALDRRNVERCLRRLNKVSLEDLEDILAGSGGERALVSADALRVRALSMNYAYDDDGWVNVEREAPFDQHAP